MAKNTFWIGEPAPMFTARSRVNQRFIFNTVAGRHVVLSFFGSTTRPGAAEFLAGIRAAGDRFDDKLASFFGVTTDPADEQTEAAQDAVPGIRFFFDDDGAISRRYGALLPDGFKPITYVLDPMLRVLHILPFEDAPSHLAALLAVMDDLPAVPPEFRAKLQAPVLVVPRIFSPELCRALITHYEEQGGRESGFMRDVNGRTVEIVEYRHKRRKDTNIRDEALRERCVARIHACLVPAIELAFQFRATRIERHIVACYSAEERGHFQAHRDNTTKGTAHRKFAVSLFLNTGEFEGGFLRFPEFGSALYQAPTGGAVVFSCSMLHEALPVTQGKRYMYLPFLYDEAGKRVRDENLRYVGPVPDGDGESMEGDTADAAGSRTG